MTKLEYFKINCCCFEETCLKQKLSPGKIFLGINGKDRRSIDNFFELVMLSTIFLSQALLDSRRIFLSGCCRRIFWVLVYFSGPKFYFTKFWFLLKYDMLKLRKVKGLQKVVFDSPRRGRVRKGDDRLVW
jgi:hypothetical protein